MQESELTLTGGPRIRGGRFLERRAATRSLVLWSGGVDSTYTLLRLLLQTEDQVFSHHVVLQGDGNDCALYRRTRYESRAIEALRPRLAAGARAFRHTTSRVEGSQGAPGGDAALLAFMAGRTAASLGLSTFDRVLLGVNGDRDPGWHPDSAACALRRARMSRAIRAAYGCDEAPQIYLWEPRPGREEMVQFLGAELASMTASCVSPATTDSGGFEPCGRCSRCLESGGGSSRPPPAGRTLPGEDGSVGRHSPLFRHLVEMQSKRSDPSAEAGAAPGP